MCAFDRWKSARNLVDFCVQKNIEGKLLDTNPFPFGFGPFSMPSFICVTVRFFWIMEFFFSDWLWGVWRGLTLTQIESEQQLVDCTYSSYDGCDGGNGADAWNYLFKVGGDEPSWAYPYTSGLTGRDGTCKFSPRKVYVKLANDGTQLPQNEVAIQTALVQKGPITCAFYVADKFMFYK